MASEGSNRAIVPVVIVAGVLIAAYLLWQRWAAEQARRRAAAAAAGKGCPASGDIVESLVGAACTAGASYYAGPAGMGAAAPVCCRAAGPIADLVKKGGQVFVDIIDKEVDFVKHVPGALSGAAESFGGLLGFGGDAKYGSFGEAFAAMACESVRKQSMDRHETVEQFAAWQAAQGGKLDCLTDAEKHAMQMQAHKKDCEAQGATFNAANNSCTFPPVWKPSGLFIATPDGTQMPYGSNYKGH